jgi:tetratricopeptide (TPR) repeat protein
MTAPAAAVPAPRVDLRAAWRESEVALDEGRRLGEAPVVTAALSTQCAVRSCEVRFGEAIALGEAAVAAAGTDPDGLRRTPHAYLGLALMGADRHDEARLVAEEGRHRATVLGQVLALPNFHHLLARLAWSTGRWDDALAEADATAALAADDGLALGQPGNQTVGALVAFHRGDLDAARDLQAQSRVVRGESADAVGTELSVLLDALLAEAGGDVERAADLLLGLTDVMSQLGMRAAQLWVGPETIRLALAGRRHGDATALADRLEEIANVAGSPTARGAAAAGRGLVKGDPDLLIAASAAYATAYRPLDRLLACEWAGAALADGGRTEEAVNALHTARELATELDASHDAHRIVASLQALGVRVGGRS